MSQRFDLTQPREWLSKDGDTPTSWTPLGTMWLNDNGKYSLTFNAMPIPQMNKNGQLEVRVQAFPPKPKGNGQQRPAQKTNDVPFPGDNAGWE